MPEMNRNDMIGKDFDTKALKQNIKVDNISKSAMFEYIQKLPSAYGPMINAMLRGGEDTAKIMAQELGDAEKAETIAKLDFGSFLENCITGVIEPQDPEASVYRFDMEYRPENIAKTLMSKMAGIIEAKQNENTQRDTEIGDYKKQMESAIADKKSALKADKMGTRNPFKRWSLRRNALKEFVKDEERKFAEYKEGRNKASEENSKQYLQPYHDAKIKMQKGDYSWVKDMDQKVSEWQKEQAPETPATQKKSMTDQLSVAIGDNKQVKGNVKDKSIEEKTLSVPQKKAVERDGLY